MALGDGTVLRRAAVELEERGQVPRGVVPLVVAALRAAASDVDRSGGGLLGTEGPALVALAREVLAGSSAREDHARDARAIARGGRG